MRESYQRLILLTNVFVALPLLLKIPLWAALLYALIMLWHELALSGRGKAPSRIVNISLIAAVGGGLMARYGTIIRIEALFTLLVIITGVTLTAIRRPRDLFLNVALNWFILMGGLLAGASQIVLIHTIASLILLTSHLIAGASGFLLSPGAAWKRSAVFFAQALPVFLLIYFLFPSLSRQAGLFWQSAGWVRTGFSDVLEPGQILKLGLDDRVAFRVSFTKGLSPAAENMYWRGAVLWNTDGLNWYNRYEILFPQSESIAGEDVVVQRIDAEPQNDPAVFALETPLAVRVTEPEMHVLAALSDHQFVYGDGKRSLSYEAHSRLSPAWDDVSKQVSRDHHNSEELTLQIRALGLEVPAEVGPEVKALVASWQANAATPAVIVSRALAHFGSGDFSYTLEPGFTMLSVRDFLFRYKRGFCGHYASVFGILMRLAGVPARVVVGYQGGTYNAAGNYWIVRQQHAHAWNEVWLDGYGWTRVDPVSVVMPERITQGESLFNFTHQSAFSKAIQGLRLFFDGLNYKWDNYFGGTGRKDGFIGGASSRFLAREMRQKLLLLVPPLLGLLILRRRRRAETELGEDQALKLYRGFCQSLTRQGLARAPHEGPFVFAERLSMRCPAAADTIQQAISAYVRARYGAVSPSHAELQELKRRFRKAAGCISKSAA